MKKPLRIAVADDEQDMRRYFAKVLPTMGHEVVVVAENGRELVARCMTEKPDLVITDIVMPALDGIEAANQLFDSLQVPVILVSAFHSDELISRAEDDHIMAYLVKPVGQSQLEPAIAIAMKRFEQFKAIQAEANNLRDALTHRNVVERAKSILMERLRTDEEGAFARLRALADDSNRTIAEMGDAVVTHGFRE